MSIQSDGSVERLLVSESIRDAIDISSLTGEGPQMWSVKLMWADRECPVTQLCWSGNHDGSIVFETRSAGLATDVACRHDLGRCQLTVGDDVLDIILLSDELSVELQADHMYRCTVGFHEVQEGPKNE